jgi:hypothetical protein
MLKEDEPRDHWIETGLVAFGAVGTIVGIGTWFNARFDLLLAFVAGAGWALVIALLVLQRRERGRRQQLLAEIQDKKEQSAELRVIAMNDSQSLNTFVARGIEPPKRPRARQSRPPVPGTSHDV